MAKSLKQNRVYYDKKSDLLWVVVKKGVEEKVLEVAPGINVELGKKGELLGIEIMNASQILGKKIFRSRIASLHA